MPSVWHLSMLGLLLANCTAAATAVAAADATVANTAPTEGLGVHRHVEDVVCRLSIRGHRMGQLGVAAASLNCTGSSPLQIGINSTQLHKFSAQFNGVAIIEDEGPECQRAAAGGSVRGKPLYALLYFCDDSKHVTLVQPNISNLYLETGNEKWTTALLAFGSQVTGVVLRGSLSHNQVGSAVAVMDQAQVTLEQTEITNNLGLEGVGVVAVQNATLNVSHSSISDNAAGTSTGTASITAASSIGGAVLAMGNAAVNLQGSVLANNTAGFGPGFYAKEFVRFHIEDSRIHNNTSLLRGAGCFLEGSVHVTVRRSNVTLNKAAFGYGGGLYLSESCTMSVEDSNLVGNSAAFSGGAFFVRHKGVLNVNNSLISENSANIYGGGIFCQENATVRITGSSVFVSNMALNSGGALTAMNRAQVYAEDSIWKMNWAKSAAGAAWMSESTSLLLSNSSLFNNTAGEYGGAVVALHSASVQVANSSTLFGNRAATGGALHAKDNSSVVIHEATLLRGNVADKDGGAVAAEGNAQAELLGVRLMNNTADRGGAVSVLQSSSVTVSEAFLRSNTASEGGGIYCSGQSELSLLGSSVIMNNTALKDGGGLDCADMCALQVAASCSSKASTLSNITRHACGIWPLVTGNKAKGGWAGGVMIENNKFNASRLQRVVHGNTARYSHDIHAGAAAVDVLGNTSISNFVSTLAATEGVLHVKLNVLAYNGLPSEGMLVQALLSSGQGSDVQYLAANRSDSDGSVVLSLKVVRPPGSYQLSFELPEALKVQPARMDLTVRRCVVGEVTPSPDVCLVCMKGSYSLDPAAAVCDPCPAGADCPGGAVMNPLPGMWHSSTVSTQLHRCPNPQACQGDRNTLQACSGTRARPCETTYSEREIESESPEDLPTSTSGVPDAVYQDLQCSTGYIGNLCGACAAGYGSTKPFACRPCLQQRVLIGLYVLAGCVMMGLLLMLCRSTVTASMASSRTGRPPSADLLRPLLVYINCLLIIGNIGVELPSSLAYAMQGLAWVWAVANPHTLSVDCLLTHGGLLPVAIKKVLFYLCMPLALLTIALLVQAILLCSMRRFRTSRTRAGSMVHYLAANGMVALMVFLPSLLNTMLSLFACISVDKPGITNGRPLTAVSLNNTTTQAPAASASAVGSFWVYEVGTRCFVGYHIRWALGLGVPLILLTCLILPVSILYLTLKHRHDPGFYRHYSFLVQCYKPKHCYWEAVVILQMIVLVAISVFGSISLGPFYSLIALNAVFAVMGLVLLSLKPYACTKANAVAGVAVCCLLLTSYVMLTFLPYGGLQAPAAYTISMGAFVVVVNAAFTLYVVWCILRSVAWRQAGQVGLRVIQSSIDLTTSLSLSLSSFTNSFSAGSGNLGAPKSPGPLPHGSQFTSQLRDPFTSGVQANKADRCGCLGAMCIRGSCCGGDPSLPVEGCFVSEGAPGCRVHPT